MPFAIAIIMVWTTGGVREGGGPVRPAAQQLRQRRVLKCATHILSLMAASVENWMNSLHQWLTGER